VLVSVDLITEYDFIIAIYICRAVAMYVVFTEWSKKVGPY